VSFVVGDAEYLESPLADAEFADLYGLAWSSVMLGLDGEWFSLDRPDEGWVVTSVDTGAPVVRETGYEHPGADGSFDDTSRVGARNILVAVTLIGSDRQGMLDLLGPWLSHRARPTLSIATEPGGAHRSLVVRHTGDFSPTWNHKTAPPTLEGTIGFRTVGWPWWQSETVQTATAFPNEGLPGLTFDVSFDVAFPDATGIGSSAIEVAGNVSSPWVARIFGPITGPTLVHEQSGQSVAFKDTLVIAGGDYLTVDSYNRTAYLNGVSSRYSFMDFTATRPDWFTLEPGTNTIRLTGSSFSTPAQAEITWRDSWR
jgi:phage-related protein